jgi:hypothetical protein
MGVGVAFLGSSTWSIAHLISKRKQVPKALGPLFVNIATLTIVLLVPFNAVTTNLDFRLHFAGRMAVVNDVLAGKYDNQLKGDGATWDLINLPSDLSYLSRGGGLIIRQRRSNRTLILFFDYQGILSSFAGFVYSSDDAPPANGDFGGNFFEVERLRKNWFWASSRN